MKFNATLLIIEDDPEVRDFLREILETRGYKVLHCGTGAEAKVITQSTSVELILLDKSLPDCDGFELYSFFQTQEKTRHTPVIFITGTEDVAQKVTAFTMGAEDYIVKPFNTLELLARIEGKISKMRMSKRRDDQIVRGHLILDISAQRAIVKTRGKEWDAELTGIEFKLIVFLAQNEEQVFRREALVNSIWGENIHVHPRTVDTHICSLRKKISPFSDYIESVTGSGYRFSSRMLIKKSAA